MRWLRNLIRRNTRPIAHNTAHIWKKRLSIAYGFIAWNAICLVGYSMYKGKRDWAAYHGLEVDQSPPSVQFSRMMDIPKAKVLRYSGFSKKEEYEVDNTKIFADVRE